MTKKLPKELYTINDAAEYLCVSPHTVRYWRHLKKGPKATVLNGHTIRYHIEDLQNFREKYREE